MVARPAEVDPVLARKRRPYRRDQIVDAAMRLFSERGYRSTIMDDIGAAAGITGPGIYRHFKSKEEILEVAVRGTGEAMLRRTDELRATLADHEARLDAYVAAFAEQAVDTPHAIFVVMRERRELPKPTRAWLNRAERQFAAEWVTELQVLRPDLADVEARVLVYAALQVALAAVKLRSGISGDRLVALVKRAMLGTMLGP